MKRWFKQAAVIEAAGGFGVALDGKPLNTPARQPAIAPTRVLADAVAAEWAAQGDRIEPSGMRLTKLLATAIDQVRPDPAKVIGQVSEYATTDLLCHRAEAGCDLRRRQDALWQPIFDWAVQRYDAPLKVVEGVLPGRPPKEALAAIRAAVAALDPLPLAGVMVTTTTSGSVLLALALAERHITVDALWEAADVDEAYQRALWGDDPMAAQRRAEVEADLRAAALYLELLRA